MRLPLFPARPHYVNYVIHGGTYEHIDRRPRMEPEQEQEPAGKIMCFRLLAPMLQRECCARVDAKKDGWGGLWWVAPCFPMVERLFV